MDRLENLRAVLATDEKTFGQTLSKVLSPSRPLTSEEFLRGRSTQLVEIERALYASGRHVLIHGLRGVGKSSLAQTVAYRVSGKHDPILVSCDADSTFSSIVRNIADEAIGRSPNVIETVKNTEISGLFSKFGISFGGRSGTQTKEGSVPEPVSTNDALRLIAFISNTFGERPIFVVDEFDLIRSDDAQQGFANLVKQVSDKHIEACFIFCGIAESAEALMKAHGSIDRYFHAVALGKLPWNSRFEIVETAAELLGIKIDRGTTIRIAAISDGFPHYIHFLSEKLFWRVFTADNGGNVEPSLFDGAMADAASAMDMKLKGPYELATQKYNDRYSKILFAVADGHELKRRSSDIFETYLRIMRDINGEPLERSQFNNAMNRLKSPAHGQILSGNRQGWYEFTEKMIRGYVRLKAELSGVDLRPDHPSARTQRSDLP